MILRFLSYLLTMVSIGLVVLPARATPANPQHGIDYRTATTPQQAEPGKKVEVIEFFWYACPHCNALDPGLVNWAKKQADHITFKRVPVAFRESFMPQQKLFYTLEAMPNAEELHKKFFYALHTERKSLHTEVAITDWAMKQGIDRQKFVEVFNSFSVQAKVRRATQLQAAYQIDGVPLIAVDGRFLTSPSIVGASIGNQPEAKLHTATLQVMDWLVAKVAKEKEQATVAQSPPNVLPKKHN